MKWFFCFLLITVDENIDSVGSIHVTHWIMVKNWLKQGIEFAPNIRMFLIIGTFIELMCNLNNIIDQSSKRACAEACKDAVHMFGKQKVNRNNI